MLYKYQNPHKHLTQMKSFCGPTCIQMVLFRSGLWVEQEQLAYDLGVILEEKNKQFHNLPFTTLPDGDPLHGFKFYSFESEKTKKILSTYGFKFSIIYYSSINNLSQIFIDAINNDQDIVINIKWEGIGRNDYTGGHYVLLSSYDTETGVVSLCDPTTRAPNYWSVHIDELLESMSGKWDGRERGLVVFER